MQNKDDLTKKLTKEQKEALEEIQEELEDLEEEAAEADKMGYRERAELAKEKIREAWRILKGVSCD